MSSVRHKWARDARDKRKVSFDELDKAVQRNLQSGPMVQETVLPEPEGWDQTDSVLIECEGYWWLHSNFDPRWHAEGKAIVGGKNMCKEAKQAFEALKQKYGPPKFPLVYKFEPRNLKKFRLAGEDKKL